MAGDLKYSLRTDEQLMDWMRRGDQEAFIELYRRHQPDLYRFSWHMTGSPHIAEEAVQETFLGLIKRPEAWVPERGSVRSFLFGIARNQVLRRVNDRHEFDELLVDVSAECDLLNDLAREERIAAVKEAVLALPATYREAIVLCDIEEISYDEAARVLDCPVGTVRSRISRGRQLLAAKLKVKLAENPA